MGMFSWECRGCGKSILNELGVNKTNGWMADAVALLPDGNVLMGTYDGYGRVAGTEIHDYGEPEIYHRACWERSGKPMEFSKASEGADDQGWFYDDADYDIPDPRSTS
jgi:hypothetical protein